MSFLDWLGKQQAATPVIAASAGQDPSDRPGI